MKIHNPPTVAGPFATYAHGVEVDEPARFLYGAGQTGVSEDGSVGNGIAEQSEIVWHNIRQVLASAGMEISDIVQLNMLLIDRSDAEIAMPIRDAALGEHRPASTLMYVAGLARPEWLIEIDFIAARPLAKGR
jgi:enamine deaminase RidA (YjgF/YER057c/UK114 family)